MTSVKNQETLRLRPHHIFCGRFLPLENLIRGEEFASSMNETRELIKLGSDLIITVEEGPDQLCRSCPDYKDGRCESPAGDEEAVRRWDSRILKGLGISYGQEMTAGVLLSLINDKAPLDFCQTRCPWKAFCGVFSD